MGYRWMIVRDDDVEDLAVGINAVSDQLELDGYGERLLCAVFGFKDAAAQPDLLHLQLQARHVVPVRARAPASTSARPSASCGSRRCSRPTSRSSPSSTAGSRSGTSRSERRWTAR